MERTVRCCVPSFRILGALLAALTVFSVALPARGAAVAEVPHPAHEGMQVRAEPKTRATGTDSMEQEGASGKQPAEETSMKQDKDPVAIDISELKTLAKAIEGVESRKIVYVGEYHDRFSHHTVELEVIKSLYRQDPKLAVGMEMFQRPFQKALDDYINGRTDEREFLKRSEYFERWGFDYHLYKPILDFARQEKIPVVALNVRKEIVDKVAREGLDALTEDEKKEIPADMDFSDTVYRARIEKVFKEHKSSGERKFESFFQAQILWDETMAMSVNEFLKKEPERRMIVLAGQGHLMYGSGIPKRAFRRNGFSYGTILNDADPEPDIADYVVMPKTAEGPTSPKLMVMLKEEGKRVTITDMPDDSLSRKAGVKPDDVLLSLDGEAVHSVADVKIALFFKNPGDSIKVKVSRKRFLLGERELTFDITFPKPDKQDKS